MYYIYLTIFCLVQYSYQCARTIDHSGSTLPPPTTERWSTTTKTVKTTTTTKEATTVPRTTSTTSTSTMSASTTSTSTTSTTTTPLNCGDPAWILSTKPQNLCFKALQIQYPAITSWNIARQMCKDVGAEIAPMRSEQERLAIKDSTSTLPNKPNWPWQPETAVYFGLRDISVSKADPTEYHWQLDNSILMNGDYTNWANTQPDRGDTEGEYDQCGSAQVYNEYKWQDILCKNYGASFLMIGVVCAKPP